MQTLHTRSVTRDDLPLLWLLSDERNDASLARALAALPAGSGFVFRHYHLGPAARRARFDDLASICRERSHVVILSGTGSEAAEWNADGCYGDCDRIGAADGLLRLATAHGAADLQRAAEAEADAVFLSPVYATRSHPDVRTLGKERFLALARQSPVPVIALGGMTTTRAEALGWPRWGAIDGLGSPNLP